MEFFDTDFLNDGEIKLVLERTAAANPERGYVPAYYFRICDQKGVNMGRIDLRVGKNQNTYYGGNIGYTVFECFRGHHYALKACRLLFQLAKMHGMEELIITCAPDNAPSRRTLEKLGGELLEIAELPPDNDMRAGMHMTHVCVFRYVLP